MDVKLFRVVSGTNDRLDGERYFENVELTAKDENIMKNIVNSFDIINMKKTIRLQGVLDGKYTVDKDTEKLLYLSENEPSRLIRIEVSYIKKDQAFIWSIIDHGCMGKFNNIMDCLGDIVVKYSMMRLARSNCNSQYGAVSV